MELKKDLDKFEKLQKAMITEIIEMVNVKVREAGLTGLESEELTGSIAYMVASLIDDTTPLEIDGERVRPYLTFRGEGDDELIHCGENSYTYEDVSGALKKLYDV